MLKHLTHIITESGKGLLSFILVSFFIFSTNKTISAQESEEKPFTYGARIGLNMPTITSENKDNSLGIGFTAGLGAKYAMSYSSSIIADLQYNMIGSSSCNIIDISGANTKTKLYGRTTLHYITIPIVYQYYFTDILGLELGPQFGFCLGGREKTKSGNEDWLSWNLTSDNYNVFDFGITTGIYTNNLIPVDDLFVSLRAYFGLTNVMKDVGSNKNICIQLGIGYIIGR